MNVCDNPNKNRGRINKKINMIEKKEGNKEVRTEKFLIHLSK